MVRISDSLDPAELERALRRLVVERLRIFALAAIVWCAALIVVIEAFAPPTRGLLHVANGVLVVSSLGALVLGRREQLGASAITGIGVALGIIQAVELALLARFTEQPTFLWIVPLAFIGAGVLVLHRWWLVCYLTVAMAGVLAIARLPDHTLAADLVLLPSAAILSMLLHEVSLRFVIHIETLRQRDRQQNAALEVALADARRQLQDRERAEAEGARLREQFTQAQKMEAVGTLAGGFAHDMNNVLGGILAVAELLRDDATPEQQEELDALIQSTQRGAELTRNLLGFARRGKYRRERVELPTLIHNLVRLLTRTVPKGVTFETALASRDLVFEGDPALVTQALVNLCLNSVDAMRGVGRITLSANHLELGGERATGLDVATGRYVIIEVTDTGSGMDAETTRRIFEPFFTTKEIGRGTGLGLPMVYGTVRSYGGGIEVRSEPGVGTTITIFLPAAEPGIEIPRRKVTRPPPARGGTILVVDDDERIRRGGRRILEARGYLVLEAGDGREALETYKRHHVDLVLLDMAMPVMGGAECFVALRDYDPDARVLLASGYTIEEDARRCLEAGALGFIDKPYTIETLTTAIARALQDQRVSTATP